MLSKKMAVSLTSLITILAFVFVVPLEAQFKTEVERTASNPETVNPETDARLDVEIMFGTPVTLPALQTAKITVTVVFENFATIVYTIGDGMGATAVVASPADVASGAPVAPVGVGALIVAPIPNPALGFSLLPTDTDLITPGVQSDGMTFTLTIPGGAIPDSAPGPPVEPAAQTVYVTVPAGIPSLNPTDTGAGSLSAAGSTSVNLRDVSGAVPVANLDRTPKVVSIQRLVTGSQTVVAALQEAEIPATDFDVRIVLTEYPNGITIDTSTQAKRDESADNLVRVDDNFATVSNLRIGTPFPRQGPAFTAATIATPPHSERATTLVPHPVEGMYEYAAASAPALGLDGLPPLGIGAGWDDTVPPTSGPDDRYHEFRVTVTPRQRALANPFEVRIGVEQFNDAGAPTQLTYVPPGLGEAPHLPNGRDILTVTVIPVDVLNRDPGFELALPDPNDAKIPANGFYLLVRNKDNSGIDYSDEADSAASTKVENVATKQTPAQLLYNVRASADLPNLETFLVNNGTINLVSYGARRGDTAPLVLGDAYISEIMWGSDAGLPDPRESQWIEIATSGPARDIGDSRLRLHFYQAHETPPAQYVDEVTGALGTVVDRVGAKNDTTQLRWSIAGKGQSGRTAVQGGIETVPISPRDRLISMYRTMVADTRAGAAAGAMMFAPGTVDTSWEQATGPAVNFQLPFVGTVQGYHIGTPGAAEFETPDEAAAIQAEADAETAAEVAEQTRVAGEGTIPTAGRVYISEIMFAGGGVLPQWIEITNGSATEEVNLSKWTITVANAAADADVSVGASATFTIPDGTIIDPSRQTGDTKTPSTILVVTEAGRNNIEAVSDQVINLQTANEVELILAGVTKRKYTLLSGEAFEITLAPGDPPKSTPPAGETAAAKTKRQAAEAEEAMKRKEATDIVGNLGADGTAAWALPMNDEGGRSSIIRAHINVRIGPAEPEGETPDDAEGPLSATRETDWVLASNTAFADPTHIRTKTYYGAMSDEGTPGFRAGSALPVELSHFRPARDKATGQVVITWSTQSELNNAGFFVKRSQQRNGEFKVINATMIAGAGTTSEKQFYTYTDTTAQPNVVYYYQIEDVSLDGNRQTLTRGIRLKGHVGAAGKATTLWGELKTSHE